MKDDAHSLVARADLHQLPHGNEHVDQLERLRGDT
jgi:hypothetical protein